MFPLRFFFKLTEDLGGKAETYSLPADLWAGDNASGLFLHLSSSEVPQEMAAGAWTEVCSAEM